MAPILRPVDSSYGSSSYTSASQQLAVSRFMSRTYGWMFVGLALTGVISMMIASSEEAVRFLFASRGIFTLLLIAELGVVMGLSFMMRRLSYPAALAGFLFYSALNGVTFSAIFLAYTMTSIAQVFFISAGMFGGLALFGSVTKKDLTGIGTFFAMGVWGLILVGLVNLFVHSEALSFGLSAAGVVIFAGLSAWDAQRIRAMAWQFSSGGVATAEEGKGAVFGALMLYLDFINLFLSLLRLFGNRRD